MFEWAEYSEDISTESLVHLVDRVSAHGSGDDRLTILLLADQRGLDLEATVAALGGRRRVILRRVWFRVYRPRCSFGFSAGRARR